MSVVYFPKSIIIKEIKRQINGKNPKSLLGSPKIIALLPNSAAAIDNYGDIGG